MKKSRCAVATAVLAATLAVGIAPAVAEESQEVRSVESAEPNAVLGNEVEQNEAADANLDDVAVPVAASIGDESASVADEPTFTTFSDDAVVNEVVETTPVAKLYAMGHVQNVG